MKGLIIFVSLLIVFTFADAKDERQYPKHYPKHFNQMNHLDDLNLTPDNQDLQTNDNLNFGSRANENFLLK